MGKTLKNWTTIEADASILRVRETLSQHGIRKVKVARPPSRATGLEHDS